MLSCEAVLEILPAVEAGEAATGDLRDHLAACEACRTEAAAVRADLARIRADLAALSPSPFLEERVLEAAGTSVPSSTVSRPSLRWGVLVGMAAAALLAGVLILASRAPEPTTELGSETVASEEGETEKGNQEKGPSQVKVPATAMQVAGQRRKGHPLGNSEHEFLTLLGAPPEGMALLGSRFLARFLPEGMISLSDGLEKAKAKLTQGRKQTFVHVWISNPQSGAECIVRAQISAQYTGSLLLDEPLARALGLEQHELPGYVTIAGDLAIKANRTRARVRVADLDGVIEIQTLTANYSRPAEFLRSGGPSKKPRIEFAGERPHMGYVGTDVSVLHKHDEIFPVADRNIPWRENEPAIIELDPRETLEAMLQYREKGLEDCYVVLPAVDSALEGPRAWRMTMQRVTLTQRFEPGAAVAIARVWRGATAIPSRESAAFTKADAKGQVSFVRTGSGVGPLRLREWRTDGSVRWHTIGGSLPSPDFIGTGVVITPKGGGWALHLQRTVTGRGAPPLGFSDQELAIARRELARRAEAAGHEGAYGASNLELVIRSSTATPWRLVEQVLLVCASPTVRIDKLRFSVEGKKGNVPYRLPRDAGLAPERRPKDGAWSKAQITLTRTGRSTHYDGLKNGKSIPLDRDSGWGHLTGRLRSLARQARSADGEPSLELRPRRDVPYADVRRVIQEAQAAGIKDIRLQSSPPR